MNDGGQRQGPKGRAQALLVAEVLKIALKIWYKMFIASPDIIYFPVI